MAFAALIVVVLTLVGVFNFGIYLLSGPKRDNNQKVVNMGAVGIAALWMAASIVAAPWIYRFAVWAMQISPSP